MPYPYLLTCLVACASISGEPIPRDRLDTMRQGLESYLSKIKNIHIIYEETFGEPDVNHPLYKIVMKRQEGERHKDLGSVAGKAAERKRPAGRPEIVRQYDLIDAYPSFRCDRKERRTHPDGSIIERHNLKFVHEGRMTDIDWTHNRAIDQAVTVTDTSVLSLSPVFALGRRLQGTLNQPLWSVLELADVTTLEGSEVINGIQTTAIKVGPRLPLSHRGAYGDEKDWVKLWLAPSYSYLPVRAEFHRAV